MENKIFNSKNQVQPVEDLSARVSSFSLGDHHHISNSYSPLVNFHGSLFSISVFFVDFDDYLHVLLFLFFCYFWTPDTTPT